MICLYKRILIALMGLLGLTYHGYATAADIDIFSGGAGSGVAPNVIVLLDNTSNWSASNQAWDASSTYQLCINGGSSSVADCQTLITQIFYVGSNNKKPWDNGFSANKDNISLTQGQVELRSLKLVLNSLVCQATTPISINVGLELLASQSANSNGDSVGVINFAVQNLSATSPNSNPSSCANLFATLNAIDNNITSPTYKAPSNANYGAALYEAFKYFGGYANPTDAAKGKGSSPTGAQGYGPIRFSKVNTLDDSNAFTDSSKATYSSPITSSNSCANNYLILIGNTYPNAEPSGSPASFANLSYSPPSLPAATSDTSRYADEWAYFLANSDVSSISGQQVIKTFAVNVFKDKEDSSQSKLLLSMANQGGLGPSAYLAVGGDLYALVSNLRATFIKIASVDSVFTATTLPVSTTTQGTYLNQIFVGMFKPSSAGNPRWYGNLKQYKLGFTNGTLDLLDSLSKPAILNGFFGSTAISYWTTDTVFFANAQLGTASDSPDGKVVEKGGAAEVLRNSNLLNSASRKVYTTVSSPAINTSLSSVPFNYSNVSSRISGTTIDSNWINWVRGENNQANTATGAEDYAGSYSVSGTTTTLPSGGARPSMHADVLHSRPFALNYGTSSSTGGVVVYYGTNDGYLHAVDGSQTATTGGSELWSFIPPEFYDSSVRIAPSLNLYNSPQNATTDKLLSDRLHDASPLMNLPENDSSGKYVATGTGSTEPKPYGMDGGIGVYASYDTTGTALGEAIIYPTMRRGGRTVYALDVTLKADPKYLWKITGGSSGTSGYTKLAQTWSLPKPLVRSSGSSKPTVVLLMGGGYDDNEDTCYGSSSISCPTSPINSAPSSGNAVFVINGRTGALIKRFDTEYSVPSDLTLVDTNRDGIIDRAYFADVRGNLYRIDLPSDTSADLSLTATWDSASMTKIASLGGKVFFPPDVVVTSNFVAVLLGTGDREKPLQNTTQDHFFLIKDNVGAPRSSALSIGDLGEIAQMKDHENATIPTPEETKGQSYVNGCYLTLTTVGEKVINAPLTASGVTYFSTNRPTPANSNQCTADLGQALTYQLPLFCAVPGTPTNITGGGLAPNPVGGVVLITNADNSTQKVNFLIGAGTNNSNFSPKQPDPSVNARRSRLYWRIDNSNR